MTDEHGALDRTLEAARRAAPALSPSRSQKWHWAVLSRLDGRQGRRVPTLVAACAVVSVAALVGWRTLGPRPALVASAPPRSETAPDRGGQTLADGTRIFPDGPTTVLEKAVESAGDVLYEL